MEEERRSGEEFRQSLEKEREELRAKLRDASDEVRGHVTREFISFRTIMRVMRPVERVEESLCCLRFAGWSR